MVWMCLLQAPSLGFQAKGINGLEIETVEGGASTQEVDLALVKHNLVSVARRWSIFIILRAHTIPKLHSEIILVDRHQVQEARGAAHLDSQDHQIKIKT